MESKFSFNPNPLVRYLQKPAELFTREDLIKYIEGNRIQHLNFRYVAADGRVTTLNFIKVVSDFWRACRRIKSFSIYGNRKFRFICCPQIPNGFYQSFSGRTINRNTLFVF